MVPKNSGSGYKSTGKSITLGQFDGPRGKGQAIYKVTVYDLKQCVAEGMKSSRLFTSVGLDDQPGSSYTLTARILGQPAEGMTTTTSAFIVDYEIKRNGTGDVVFKKTITGKHSVSPGEALVGVTRVRLAIEGSVRDNVNQLLEAISQRQL